jgi:hypothetical protein
VKAIQRVQSRQRFEWAPYIHDFFPYSGNFNLHYWTGFYTSRPHFKKIVREFSALTQQSETIFALTGARKESSLLKLQET